MSSLTERLQRHLDDIDPSRAHARVGVQCGVALALAVLALWATPWWPSSLVWAGVGAVIVHIAIASATGSLRQELGIAAAVATTGMIAVVVGSYANADTDWFLPVMTGVAFLTGLGDGFDVTGRKIGLTAFVAFSLAATVGPETGDLGVRAAAMALGVGAAVVAIVAFHAAGRLAGWADFGRPPPPPRVFQFVPAIDRSTLVHAARMALTVLGASAIAELLGVAHPLWMMLTIAVVLQRRLGETLIKGAQRLSGTFIGAAVGWAIATLVGPDNAAWLLLLVPVAIVGRYLYVPANYAVGIAFATCFVIFVYSALGRPLTASALERLGDTLIAAAMGVVVSMILLPERVAEAAKLALIRFFAAAAVQYRLALAAALGERPDDFDGRASAFEAVARAAAKEIRIARWEAFPGRRIFGLRREVRSLIEAIYRAIRDLSAETSPVPPDAAAHRDFLVAEADDIAAVFQELEATVRHRRPAALEARALCKRLLRDAERDDVPFTHARRALIGSLSDFLGVQERRFGSGRALRPAPAG